MTFPLAALLGSLVGLSLGLTGGGGAILAVPLLVYGLGQGTRDAVSISLLTVAVVSLLGCADRARRKQVEFPTGLLFAVSGVVTAPAGTWLAHRIPETALLLLFSLLMLVIAVRTWRESAAALREFVPEDGLRTGPVCHRDPEGVLRITSLCAMLLVAIGAGTGILTGMFGVGGGFIIVPALVAFSGMDTQRAIGTSLLVIAMVSSSSIVSRLGSIGVPGMLAELFCTGSVAGLFAGAALSRKLSGPSLQKTFAAVVVLLALYVITRSILHK